MLLITVIGVERGAVHFWFFGMHVQAAVGALLSFVNIVQRVVWIGEQGRSHAFLFGSRQTLVVDAIPWGDFHVPRFVCGGGGARGVVLGLLRVDARLELVRAGARRLLVRALLGRAGARLELAVRAARALGVILVLDAGDSGGEGLGRRARRLLGRARRRAALVLAVGARDGGGGGLWGDGDAA